MTRFPAFFRGGLIRVLLGYVVIYALLAAATDAPQMILALNGIALGMSAGVCFAYAPNLAAALLARHPDNGDYLGLGIFFVSAGVFVMRAMSSIARDFGHPEIYNTDIVTAALSLAILGAWFHLRAPEIGISHLPQRRWVTGGTAVALGVFLTFLLAVAHSQIGAAPSVQLR